MTGIRTIEDIRQRCVIDEGGCWLWSGAMRSQAAGRGHTPMLHLPRGVLGERAVVTSGPRVAWLLSGKRLPTGHMVWRDCCNSRCLNPEHLRAGTPAALGRHITRHGLIRVDPMYRARRVLQCPWKVTPPEVIRAIEADIQAGRPRKEIQAAHGVGRSLVWRVATGQHQHQRGRLVPGASIFAMGGVR